MSSNVDLNLDVEEYFLPIEWLEMSDIAKTIAKNELENWKKMKEFGFHSQEPDFVEAYRKRKEEDEIRIRGILQAQSNNKVNEGASTSSGATWNWNPPISKKSFEKSSADVEQIAGTSRPVSAQFEYPAQLKNPVQEPTSYSVRLDIEKYFSDGEWAQKTDEEKERLRAELGTYSLNRTFGRNPEAPEYVVAYKERKFKQWLLKDRKMVIAAIKDGYSKPADVKEVLEPAQTTEQDITFYCAECNLAFTSPLFLEQHEMTCLLGLGAKEKQVLIALKNEERLALAADDGENGGRTAEERLALAADDGENGGRTAESDEQLLRKKSLSGRRFVCEICNARLSSKYSLICHVKGMHDNVRPFKCGNCNKAFVLKSKLHNHINAVHLKVKIFKCNMCDYKFSHTRDVRRHINAVHLNKRQFECCECGSRFAQKSQLKTHISSVHLNERNFECSQCYKRFNRFDTLKRHLNAVHLNERKYECDQCYMRFNQNSHLKTHISSVHLNERKFQCNHCGLFFTRNDYLKTHVWIVHLHE